ncbi:uncharacterized protein TNCV_4935831 [Trichonephila clavipes]|nr:uncharacterized protein TNCV_4935831 [Trichonephila clavipes]
MSVCLLWVGVATLFAVNNHSGSQFPFMPPSSKFHDYHHMKFVDNRQWGLAMSERSRLPDSLRWRVVGWMEIGLSQADAAGRLNVSRSVVHRLCNQYQTKASVSRRHVPGRPRATTPAGDRFITLSA